MTARRLVVAAALLFVTTACAHDRELLDGGVVTTRSGCPIAGIPAGTGDVTLFDPAGNTTSAAIDVVATITNLRTHCVISGSDFVSTSTFDIVASRRDRGPARSVTLAYYDAVMQGGAQVIAKHVNGAVLNFAEGSQRAATRAVAVARVSRAATSLPTAVMRRLAQPRKAGEAEAAVDPMSDPTVRAAVANATFEQLIGFQLTQDQLRYNATR